MSATWAPVGEAALPLVETLSPSRSLESTSVFGLPRPPSGLKRSFCTLQTVMKDKAGFCATSIWIINFCTDFWNLYPNWPEANDLRKSTSCDRTASLLHYMNNLNTNPQITHCVIQNHRSYFSVNPCSYCPLLLSSCTEIQHNWSLRVVFTSWFVRWNI